MPVIPISNGIIEEISRERGNTFVTVTYGTGFGNQRNEQRIRLVVGPRTIIVNSNGTPIPVSALAVGMRINATVSSAMTRSIPPQATAYLIRIVSRAPQEAVTVGRILEADRRGRNFTTISDRDPSSIIRFNVSEDTTFLGRVGRPIDFAALTPGLRVRVRHANFMTASIPPQTTAFEVQVL